MDIDREKVRTLVREELARRLSHQPGAAHPALADIYRGVECSEDMDFPVRVTCVIEPERPCYNSGYCKKLGH